MLFSPPEHGLQRDSPTKEALVRDLDGDLCHHSTAYPSWASKALRKKAINSSSKLQLNKKGLNKLATGNNVMFR